jgi:hypothetical protein
VRRLALAGLAALAVAAPPAAAAEPLPAATIEARERVFGAEHVAPDGSLPRGKVVLSWFSVGSFAAAFDGRVVLLDTYIHKVESGPSYVPTTVAEITALRPEAIFLGHGHFDHGKYAGLIAARTGAVLVGTPEHCDQARDEAAGRPVRCVAAVPRGSAPGAGGPVDVLGPDVAVSALKHVHSAAEPPDGEHHETVITGAPLSADPSGVLLHPPGPSVLPGLDPGGDEGGTVLYRFAVGPLAVVWHDSSGPLRERAPAVLGTLRAMPPTDVQVGAVLGFNEPTNGVRDPVDYLAALRPKLFVPNHHDFVTEYGTGRAYEGAVRRELARRGSFDTQFRWLADPGDYLRPLVFDAAAPRFRDAADAPRLQLVRRCTGGGRLRVELRGETSAVRDVRFTPGGQDDAAPFRKVVGRTALSRTRARTLRAVVAQRFGEAPVVLRRPLPRCGL